MSRIIVVSNRVQVEDVASSGAQGGLATALSAALKEYRGIWFGWSGCRTDDFSGQINVQHHQGVTTATVDLDDQDIEEYYDGYANRTLWPLFHYRIDLAEYERGFAAGYQRVNERFAETVRPLVEPDDAVWIQDYHLIPLGAELRRLGCMNRMGFSLHIPWPPPRLLSTLPDAKALVEALFAYDIVGFQTQEWLDSFTEFATRHMDAILDDGDGIRLGDQIMRAVAVPTGIPVQEFVEAAESEVAKEICDRLRSSSNGRTMIVGVDRLDYSKGLEERFLGYERFLADHPDQRKQVFLLQIAPPTRSRVESYQRIRATLDALSGRINGAYADLDWVPIRYVNQGYSRADLAGVYRAARIALVTPLRDGMNLVAKEYVAAQDPTDPGVLILSRFAGAASQLAEALLVNPYSAEEMADAIHTAVNMPRGERIRRWRALMDNVTREDVLWWRQKFTSLLMDVALSARRVSLCEEAGVAT